MTAPETPLQHPEPFGVRLRRAMDTRGPLCVGIDPHAALLADWGLSDDIAGLERFTRTVVDALADRVAVLKPQSAFFERFGSRGVAVLERAVADARSAGALVLMDAKRGDIGSTMAAYAATYLDKDSPLFSDAVTVSPYLGFGSLRPALDAARISGAGVFVLALTSNPEGAEVQHAVGADGRTVAAAVLSRLKTENGKDAEDAAAAGAAPAAAGALGSYGAVVGATLGGTLGAAGADLMIDGPLLAPGIGAQGATPADLPGVFGAAVRNVVPSVSRGVLRHGPDAAALRASAARFAEEVRAAVGPR
ncbi:orotidine-5'-phosphate decarboxylase [Streptomyces sp. H27-D2]|uniref:orotidine-5'-phosphate decarboxylase n=1 Tax=Streptomyces sp. H27-D2 TaxID=3046304 RepID=UPI002DBCFEF1|nr:orotidine-5'-phosphate decarboxylase [Streptomyces sp. H27-D2]MEC4015543.1 orotidine-5'-phosphate decarboxylase [Streptomyces sp. H27-D2]